MTYGEKNILFDAGNLTIYEGDSAVASPVIPYRVFSGDTRIFKVVR